MWKIGKGIAIGLLVSFALSSTSYATCHHKKDGEWQDRMKAEKVAYLTTEMELTPSEAEKFWPLYNKMEEERVASFKRVVDAYKALDEGMKAGKGDKEIASLIDKYAAAVKESRSVEAEYVPVFKKVLSVEKVAKLFLGEEHFRRRQISRWSADKPKP